MSSLFQEMTTLTPDAQLFYMWTWNRFFFHRLILRTFVTHLHGHRLFTLWTPPNSTWWKLPILIKVMSPLFQEIFGRLWYHSTENEMSFKIKKKKLIWSPWWTENLKIQFSNSDTPFPSSLTINVLFFLINGKFYESHPLFCSLAAKVRKGLKFKKKQKYRFYPPFP